MTKAPPVSDDELERARARAEALRKIIEEYARCTRPT